jgi:nicotinic acid mononucleotide adenylyltransferase
MEPVDVSSTVVRMLLQEGKSVDGLVPERVIEYLQENRLYRG